VLVKLSDTHYIKAWDIDEVTIDAVHNRVKVTSNLMGVMTIEPEEGESLKDIAERIIGSVNLSGYNYLEAQTR
jgi:hypothetical protein